MIWYRILLSSFCYFGPVLASASASAQSKIQLFKNESEWNSSIYTKEWRTLVHQRTKIPNKRSTNGYGKYNTIFGIKWKIRVKEKQCYISNKCTVWKMLIFDIEREKNKQIQKKEEERKTKVKRENDREQATQKDEGDRNTMRCSASIITVYRFRLLAKRKFNPTEPNRTKPNRMKWNIPMWKKLKWVCPPRVAHNKAIDF